MIAFQTPKNPNIPKVKRGMEGIYVNILYLIQDFLFVLFSLSAIPTKNTTTASFAIWVGKPKASTKKVKAFHPRSCFN